MNFRKIEKVESLVRPRVRRGHTDSTAALVLERIFDVANWHPRANHGAPDQGERSGSTLSNQIVPEHWPCWDSRLGPD